MERTVDKKNLRRAGAIIYFIFLILLSVLIFLINDDKAPIANILHLNYLIPVLIYAAIPLLLSYFLFLLIEKILNKYVSFILSMVIGIPVGLILLQIFFT